MAKKGTHSSSSLTRKHFPSHKDINSAHNETQNRTRSQNNHVSIKSWLCCHTV